MATIDTLRYFLLCEYLNPQIPKMQNHENRVEIDIKIDEINEKFVEKLGELKNLLEEKYQLGVAIMGIYKLDAIKNEIIKAHPELESDEFEQESLINLASFRFEMSGKPKIRLKETVIGLEKAKNSNLLSAGSGLCPFAGNNSATGFRADAKTFELSYTPWAVANFDRLKDLNLDDLREIKAKIIAQIETLQEECDLKTYINKINDIVQSAVKSPLISDSVRLTLYTYKNNAERETFLNSLFISDIKRILEHYNSGKKDALIDSFLDETQESDLSASRIDLRKDENLDVVREIFSMKNYPLGAFPGKFALRFSQQIALNSIYKRFIKEKNIGIYSVNGPPGTGKTTLLKDIMAMIVTERALALSKLNRSQIFRAIKDDDGKAKFYELNEKLTGFEIVVSSFNNAAVENISKEVPEISSIEAKYLDEIDYFRFIGTRLLSNGEKSAIARPAWGLFAATLGNKTNKNSFIFNAILNSKNLSDFKAIKEKFGEGAIIQKGDELALAGLRDYLFSAKSESFEEAKAKFKEALEHVKMELVWKEKLQENYKSAKTETEKLRSKIENRNPENLAFSEIEAKIDELSSAASEMKNEADSLQNRALLANSERPIKFAFMAIHALLKTAKFREFSAKNDEISAKIKALNEQEDEVRAQIKVTSKEIENLGELKKMIENLNASEKKFAEFSEEIESEFDLNRDKRELSSPFMAKDGQKSALFEARISLFIAALNLHRAAIFECRAQMSANLGLLRDIFTGGEKAKKLEKKERASVLKSLFFAVPVASSTFSSFDRCFADFSQNDIGWLLIDEAGQAAPASAIGALFRAKRAVVVGDPLQLEPVVTLPKSINKAILDFTGAKDEFNLASTSVQARADKCQNLGSYIGQTWVGSPLVVHNRCDEPMFSLSNSTTYDNLMVYGCDEQNDSLGKFGVKSSWIDVKTVENEWLGNCSQAEKMALKSLLENELAAVDRKEIKIITPFTDVVRQIKGAGTIHTMQGKQAKVVIFILGGKSNGALEWASSKPNLLNVALTRAQEYIYIIGDKERWGRMEFFSEVASKMP